MQTQVLAAHVKKYRQYAAKRRRPSQAAAFKDTLCSRFTDLRHVAHQPRAALVVNAA